jgi:GNAT superfamily N-acetyltransferase
MRTEDFEIVEGDAVKERLKPVQFEALLDAWVDEHFQPIDSPVSEIRRTIESISPLFAGFGRLIRQKGEWKQRAELKGYIREIVEKSIEEGTMVVAEKDGRILGMIKVSRLKEVGENNLVRGDVFEMGKAFTIPEARGQGIYRQLRAAMIRRVQKKPS